MDQFAIWLLVAAVYLIYIGTFVTASLQKWKSGMEDWFRKQFEKTILNKIPGGIVMGFWTITILESVTALLFIWSLLTLEGFSPGPRPILALASSMAAFTFASLGVGLRIAGDFQGSANLFIYLGATVVIKHYLGL